MSYRPGDELNSGWRTGEAAWPNVNMLLMKEAGWDQARIGAFHRML
jgi:hypothetical protein